MRAVMRASDTVSSMWIFSPGLALYVLRLKYALPPDWSQIPLGGNMPVVSLIPTIRSQRNLTSYSIESYEALTS
jgi:hypothetical protein